MRRLHKIERRQADLTSEAHWAELSLLALNRKVDVLLQWVCHLVERTYDVEDFLKFPLHLENKSKPEKLTVKPFDAYTIKFRNNGQEQVDDIKAASPGHAQSKFRRRNPNAKILGVWLEGKMAGRPWRINYEVVSPVRVKAEPALKAEQRVFSLLKEIPVNLRRRKRWITGTFQPQ